MRLLDGDHRVRQALLSGELAATPARLRESVEQVPVMVSLDNVQ
jgi:hypothetical protein